MKLRNQPTKTSKENLNDQLKRLITEIISNSFRKGVFPDVLHFAEMSPVFQKYYNLHKENCRSASVFSHASKAPERLIYKQLEDFIEDNLRSLLAGFGKNQHWLVNMLEEWKKIDNGKIFGRSFMDFSKAFDTISYDFLIAK